MMMTKNRIFVENEFAPLKRVVLAASEYGYPMTVRPEDLRFLNESATEDAKRLFHSFLLLMIQPLAKVRLLKAEMCLC